MIIWLCCFGPVVAHYVMVREHGRQEATEIGRGQGLNIPFKDTDLTVA